MTPIPENDSRQLRQDLLRTDDVLAEKLERLNNQMVMAYDEHDDDKYRELATRQGQIVAARLLKNIYGTLDNITDDYKDKHL